MPLETPSENPAEQPLDPAVVKPVLQTREKIHNAVGTSAEVISDIAQFGIEGTAYTAGRGVHTLGLGVWRAVRGVVGKPFKNAA